MTDSAAPAPSRSEAADGRAEALAPVSRSIIIGLGGTGHQVLLDVRRRIIDKYGSLKNLPIVHFIEIDTDEDVMREQNTHDDDPPEVNLQSAEKLWAAIGDVQSLEDNLQQYPYIASWLDRNALLRGKDVQHGAGAIRARGRLALFRNYDKLQVLLESAYKRIADPKVMEQCQAMGLKVSQSVTVYVVGSLLGGTCSGMFLDMAYIAGKLVPGNPDVIGIFSIPPIATGRQDHRANAYAALLELNHYCYPHTEFRAQYTPTQPEMRNRREPFTYTYLVGMYNGQQQLGSVRDQVSLVGHSIFLDLTSEFQAQKRSNRDNFQQFLIHSDRIGCPQSFMSFGLSSIHFPKDKVITACAYRLAAETVEHWLSTDAHYSDDQLHKYVGDRLAELKLLPGDVSQWLRLSQDGESLDSVVDHWREGLNEEMVRTQPPANQMAATISAHDSQMQQQNLRDADPNADVLQKNPENLGLYVRQMQRNLRSRGLQQAPRDLEQWVVRMVDDPLYRQSTARAALLHARQLFVQAASNLDGAVQQNLQPAEPFREQAKDGALQKLHTDAGSFILKMVPGAFQETMNKDREEAILACASYYRARVDTMAARYAARFYHEMPSIIDRIIGDIDAYMVKLDSMRNEFKTKEGETIASPVFVNGERLWDRDNDVNTYYAQYARPEKKDAVSAATLRSLVEGGQLYGLRGHDDGKVRRTLLHEASLVFEPLREDVDVLTRLFQKYPDGPRRLEAIRQVHRVSQPFIDLKPAFYQSADDFVALEGKRQTVVGVHNGATPGTSQESEFKNLLLQIDPLSPEKFAMLRDRYEVLFLRESAAFPLRLMREVDAYKVDYEFFATQGATQNPLHIRKDVTRWEPIYVPGSYEQDAAWETFAVGWACGVIQDLVDRSGKMTFTTSFRDEFGMPVDRTVGHLLEIDSELEKKADEPAAGGPANPLPPNHVRDIMLTLCGDKTLMDGVRRSIEGRLVHLGGAQFASVLATHAEGQKERGLPFYEAYRQRLIKFMSDRNIRPDAIPEGQPARIEISPADAAVRRDGGLALTVRVFDSISRPLTNLPVNWSARPHDVGHVDARGHFRALADGEATITATCGTVSAVAHIRVTDKAPETGAWSEDGQAALPAANNGSGPVGMSDGLIALPAAEPTPAIAAPLPTAPVTTPAATLSTPLPTAVVTPPGPAAGTTSLGNCVCGNPIEPGFKVCPECGKPFECRNGHAVKPTWKKCPYCADDLSPRVVEAPEPVRCRSCGTELETGFKVCPECGEAV